MKIRILGCSGGIGTGLNTTSLLIDDDILIDAGSGLGTLSLEEMVSLRHIFVTHSHLDHVCFIPLLVDTIFDRLDEPLVVHGQASTLKALREHIFNWVVWPDFAELPHPDKPVLRYEVMAPGDIVEESAGKSFAFSGDTTTNDTFWEALNARGRLDMLIVETAFSDQELQLSKLARHYCPSLLSNDIKKLTLRPDIYISHLKPGAEKRIMDELRQLVKDRDLKRLDCNTEFEL
jgi:ribonuclease BN (tRNA processing enzyme)